MYLMNTLYIFFYYKYSREKFTYEYTLNGDPWIRDMFFFQLLKNGGEKVLMVVAGDTNLVTWHHKKCL